MIPNPNSASSPVLLGSHPLDGSDVPVVTLSAGSLAFERMPFRIDDIETTTNLSLWESWNVPENVGGYGATGVMEDISFDASANLQRLFRLKVRET